MNLETIKISITNKPLVMGIVNITKDSFFNGGKYFDFDKAYNRVIEIQSEGADIVDIGAESTRPGSLPLKEEDEIDRLVPLISSLKKEIKIPISCDTYKSKVAEKVLENGVGIINDIYAMRYDNRMAEVIKNAGCSVVLMHMQGTPETMQKNPFYKDVIKEVKDFFKERIDFAEKRGINPENIIIDPGIGFGKRVEDNLLILNRLKEFTFLEKPILIGTSRKSFLGKIQGDNGPVEERLESSIASCVVAYINGAKIFRVHDVKEIKRALNTVYKINYENSWT
ncbi:MAG: dihydropteroate synthase [Candidatus Omnitrophica bacterium]|jgi:dihydropteroate synthase|nr:dihydropteroate synthase [Candidatus Omnitrophota bacterium]